MTRVRVTSGICGFQTVVTATMGEKKVISIQVESECQMVKAMAVDVPTLGWKELFLGFAANPVYIAANRHLRHVTCPVPCGILKAAEVEAEFALKKDVAIEFIQ